MNFPVLFNKFKYYYYYSKKIHNKERVLTMCESLKPTDIIIAWRMSKSDSKSPTYLFFKFDSLTQFIQECYNILSERYKRFYIVFNTNIRCLYMDLDSYWALDVDVNNYTTIIINTLIANIKRIYKTLKTKDVYIWQANRMVTKHYKISLHIICPTIKFRILEMKTFMVDIKRKVDFDLKKLDMLSGIDLNIYNVNYQLWRLPYNHTGNITSTLVSYSHNKLTIYEQFTINKCYENSVSNYTQKISNERLMIVDPKSKHVNSKPLLHHKIIKLFGNVQYIHIEEFKYYIRDHICPISRRKHKHNGGIITLYSNIYTYFSYQCLDKTDCGDHRYYISTSTHIHYPWLITLKSLDCLRTEQKKKLDVFLWRLTGTAILYDNEYDNYEILIRKYIKCHYHNNYIHGILSQNIKCLSGHDSLELHYRKRSHCDWRKSRDIVIYCKRCNKFLF